MRQEGQNKEDDPSLANGGQACRSQPALLLSQLPAYQQILQNEKSIFYDIIMVCLVFIQAVLILTECVQQSEPVTPLQMFSIGYLFAAFALLLGLLLRFKRIKFRYKSSSMTGAIFSFLCTQVAVLHIVVFELFLADMQRHFWSGIFAYELLAWVFQTICCKKNLALLYTNNLLLYMIIRYQIVNGFHMGSLAFSIVLGLLIVFNNYNQFVDQTLSRKKQEEAEARKRKKSQKQIEQYDAKAGKEIESSGKSPGTQLEFFSSMLKIMPIGTMLVNSRKEVIFSNYTFVQLFKCNPQVALHNILQLCCSAQQQSPPSGSDKVLSGNCNNIKDCVNGNGVQLEQPRQPIVRKLSSGNSQDIKINFPLCNNMQTKELFSFEQFEQQCNPQVIEGKVSKSQRNIAININEIRQIDSQLREILSTFFSNQSNSNIPAQSNQSSQQLPQGKVAGDLFQTSNYKIGYYQYINDQLKIMVLFFSFLCLVTSIRFLDYDLIPFINQLPQLHLLSNLHQLACLHRFLFFIHFSSIHISLFYHFQQSSTNPILIKLKLIYHDQHIILNFTKYILNKREGPEDIVLIVAEQNWTELFKQNERDVKREQMRLFGSLSHELRTPLNCSISMLEMLEKEIQDSSLIQDYLIPALSSNKLLLSLINDILDLVQMDSGKFKYTFVDFDLYKLLQDCLILVSMIASVKGLRLELLYDEIKVPRCVRSDPNRVRQIILNLLSNALKFTEEGEVDIIVDQVAATEVEPLPPFAVAAGSGGDGGNSNVLNVMCNGVLNQDEDNAIPNVDNNNKILIEMQSSRKSGPKLIQISVRDTGIGIAKENQEKIFTMFNKVDLQGNQRMNTNGCGLGLLISNQLAKGLIINCKDNANMEGIIGGIQVISETGKGSTFSFKIENQRDEKTSPFRNRSYKNSQYSKSRKRGHTSKQLSKTFQTFTDSEIQQELQFQKMSTQNQQEQVVHIYNEKPAFNQTFEGGRYLSESEYQQFLIRQHNHSQTQPPQHGYNTQHRGSNQSNYTNGPLQQPMTLPAAGSLSNIPRGSQSSAANKRGSSSRPGSEPQLEGISNWKQINTNTIGLGSHGPQSCQPSEQYYGKESSIFSMHQNQQFIHEQCLARLQLHFQSRTCKCPQILIVDDNEFNLYALGKMLAQYDVLFTTANSGQVALQRVQQLFEKDCCRQYQVIFMDISMPGLDGYETTQLIYKYYNQVLKNNDNAQGNGTLFASSEVAPTKCFFIACTAYSEEEDRLRAQQTGLHEFLSKPILKQDLEDLLFDLFVDDN